MSLGLGLGSRLRSISRTSTIVRFDAFQNLTLSAVTAPCPGSTITHSHRFSIFYLFCIPFPVLRSLSRLYLYRVCNSLPVSKQLARELHPVGVCIINECSFINNTASSPTITSKAKEWCGWVYILIRRQMDKADQLVRLGCPAPSPHPAPSALIAIENTCLKPGRDRRHGVRFSPPPPERAR